MQAPTKATIVCVLKSGGEYDERHVLWLQKQLPSLICLSDIEINGVSCVPLRFGWNGWWSKMELFSNSIKGDILYFDLDTVVVGDIDELFVGKTTLLRDFYHENRLGSGLMYIAQSDKQKIWDIFKKNPMLYMMQYNKPSKWGDQAFIQDNIGDVQRWQDILPNKIVSYKVHCKNELPSDAKVVCFHGKPRPYDLKKEWIPTFI